MPSTDPKAQLAALSDEDDSGAKELAERLRAEQSSLSPRAAALRSTIEGRRGGKFRGRTAVEACPDALGVNRGDGCAKYGDGGGHYPSQPPAAALHRTLAFLSRS